MNLVEFVFKKSLLFGKSWLKKTAQSKSWPSMFSFVIDRKLERTIYIYKLYTVMPIIKINFVSILPKYDGDLLLKAAAA